MARRTLQLDLGLWCCAKALHAGLCFSSSQLAFSLVCAHGARREAVQKPVTKLFLWCFELHQLSLKVEAVEIAVFVYHAR